MRARCCCDPLFFRSLYVYGLKVVLRGGVAPGERGTGVQGFCGADPLVAVPHTSMCMGVDSFTERTGGPHVMWAYISLQWT